VRVWLAWLACTGCNALFGIHDLPSETTDAGSDADAGPRVVTGSLVLMWAQNDSQHRPTVMSKPLDAGVVTLQVRVGDLAPEPVELAADGSFAFAADGAYQLEIDGGASFPQVFSSDAPTLALAITSIGRPDALPVTLPTPVRLDILNVAPSSVV